MRGAWWRRSRVRAGAGCASYDYRVTTGPRHAGKVKTKGRDNKRSWGPYQRGVGNQTENPSGCSTKPRRDQQGTVDRRLTRRGSRQAKRGRVVAEHRPRESPETAIVGGGPASTRGDLPRRGRTVRTSSNRQVRNPSVTTYISSPCPNPPLVDANPNVHRASHPPGGPCRALIAGRVAHRRVLVGQGSPTPSAHTGIRGIVAPVSRRTRRGSRRSSQGLRQPCSLSIPPSWQVPASPTSPKTSCSELRQLR